MRLMLLAALLLLSLGLTACQSDCNQPNAFGAAPAPETDIFGNECGKPVYAGPMCPDTGPFAAADAWLDDLFGCNPKPPPALAAPMCAPPAAAAPQCAPPQAFAAAPPQWGPCGQPPAHAKPGENWCCVKIQPAAAPPQKVCVKPACQNCIPVAAVMGTESRQVLCTPARVEWQRIECAAAGAEAECWQLVEIPAAYRTETYEVCITPASTRYEEIPAVYEMRMSAPPPPFWEWRKIDDCAPPPAAAFDCPPAGAIGSPD